MATTSARLITGLVLAAATMTAVAPAHAITNGEPDRDGHPYVGILAAEWLTPGVKTRFCSGTLVAPRAFLTAAHCIVNLGNYGVEPNEVWVSFDAEFDGTHSTIYHGTGVPDPEYQSYTGQGGFSDPHDIAVVHLDVAPPIALDAALPTEGLLDSVDLHDQRFTVVGYGRTRDDKTGGPHAIEDPNRYPSVRYVSSSSFLSLQPAWITLSQNLARDDGGGCAGDSGSSPFFGDSNIMVGLLSFNDSQCRATGRWGRLDTGQARRFMASQGIALP